MFSCQSKTTSQIIESMPEFSGILETAKITAVEWVHDCLPKLEHTKENLIVVGEILQVLQNVRIDEALLENMSHRSQPTQLAIDFGEDEPIDIDAEVQHEDVFEEVQ